MRHRPSTLALPCLRVWSCLYARLASRTLARVNRYYNGEVMRRVFCLCGLVAAVTFAVAAPVTAAQPAFVQAATQARTTLMRAYYAGDGSWRVCNAPSCALVRGDWGADSLTDTLYLEWERSGDAGLAKTIARIASGLPAYGHACSQGPCPYWSDTPAWDAVTLMRAYAVAGDPRLLARAQAAVRYVTRSKAFTGGACSSIPFERADIAVSAIKTLETDANVTKAELLLYRATHDRRYLRDARARYAEDRRYFLDPSIPLYTVHVIDDGLQCAQVSHRFFASVNGDMIWNGLALGKATGDDAYDREAVATAEAVDTYLSDGRGVFIDLQGENDVVEPLVEAMEALALQQHAAFARAWILRDAAAALSSRAPSGVYGRFFDGPPQTVATAWETNGAMALEIAAATIAPDAAAAERTGWNAGVTVVKALKRLPATISFEGSGIALVGTMSAICEHQHVAVYVDGVRTFDRTGLWQNPSMPAGPSVLFAWRWSKPGRHTIELVPGGSTTLRAGVVDLDGLVTYSPGT
jgi:hypothetical protein